MRQALTILLTFAMLCNFVPTARARSPVEVVNAEAVYTFGEQITFMAHFQTSLAIREAYLAFRAAGEQATHIVPVEVDAEGRSAYRYDVTQGRVRPFVNISFWYDLVLADNSTFHSPSYDFRYNDNRFSWQTLEDNLLRVSWYDGDLTFGQAAFDAAHTGLQAVQALISAPMDEPIDLYIYATVDDLQSALYLGGYTWVGGHASPDLGVVMASIASDENQHMEMARQIPHELAHILLYRLTGDAYVRLPTWLVEGIASQVEQYSGVDYALALARANEEDTLLPIADLCGPFPMDASNALLAYAESASFVRTLRETYGTSGLQALIRAYADGLSCEQGAQRALGLPLSQLDLHWRQSALGKDVTGIAFQNLLPYLFLLVIILTTVAWGWGRIRRG